MTKAQPQGESAGPFSRKVLEFHAVIELVRGFLSGPIAGPLLDALEPGTELEQIRRALALAADALEYRREHPRPRLDSLKDPRTFLAELQVEGASLAAKEILVVLEVARAARDLRPVFQKTPCARLDDLARRLPDFRSLLAEIDGKILPDGTLDSSASPELGRIRRAIEHTRRELERTLEKLITRLSKDQVLQDSVVTIRNERFVIPVRAEEKRRVAGVIHGASASGATVYLEPLETVPLNNELTELQDAELAEVQRILAEFTAKLRARREDLALATEILSELDLTFAKAEFARAYDCCLPLFVAGRALVLKDVRHPLLERALAERNAHAVPVTLELSEPKSLMVISGPNTGGKTVALKTLGVAVLMAQAGLPVAATEARLPVFGRVLADIGDQQSIAANLSTFSAHVANIQAMAERAGRDDLVLLDELGTSTEPSEGAALAIAILEHFRKLGTMTFVTTHHSRLKAYAAETSEAVNAAMEFNEATLQPTYRLLIGLPGKSNALDIAERLGLELSIVRKARELLAPADAEAGALVASLHEKRAEIERETERLGEERRAVEARQQELEKSFERERRAKLRELDARLEEALRQFDRKWETTLAEMRARAETQQAAKKLARKAVSLKSEVQEEWNAQVLEALGAPAGGEPTLKNAPLAVGDRVRLANLSTPGTVVALPDGEHVEVEVGRLRMRVRKGEVEVLAGAKSPAGPGPRVVAERTGDVAAEINVIGSTAEEARERVDKFLDQAYMAGRFRLRVVHGHGKGILRKALHEMFAAHPHVEKFYAAPPEEGGAGATMVELKL